MTTLGKTGRAKILKELCKNPLAFCIDCISDIDDASANRLEKVIHNFLPADSYLLISREISEKTQKHHFHVFFSNMNKNQYRRMRESKEGLLNFYKSNGLKLGSKTDDRFMGKINKIKDVLMLQSYTIKDDQWKAFAGMDLFKTRRSDVNFRPHKYITQLITGGLPAWTKGGHHCKGCNCASNNKVLKMVEYFSERKPVAMEQIVNRFHEKYERLPTKQTILLIMYRLKQIDATEYLAKIGL